RYRLRVAALHRSGELGARFRHSREHRLLLLGVPLHRLHQVRSEIGAPLHLHLDLRRGGVHLLVIRPDRVVAAAGREQNRQRSRVPPPPLVRGHLCITPVRVIPLSPGSSLGPSSHCAEAHRSRVRVVSHRAHASAWENPGPAHNSPQRWATPGDSHTPPSAPPRRDTPPPAGLWLPPRASRPALL